MNTQPSDQSGFRMRSHAARVSGDCRLVNDSIDEFVLGILDSAQRTTLERHLHHCSQCSALIASYQQTADVLALAVPMATPPASARTALLTRIAETPQLVTSGSSVYAGSLDVFRTPTLPPSTLVAPLPAKLESQSAWWRIYAAPLATLPLLLALGLVAAWGLNNYSQLHDTKGEVAQRDLQIARLSSQLSTENSQGVANLMSSQSAKRYTLAPEVATVGYDPNGILVVDSQAAQAALQVSGLPAGTYSVVVQLQNGETVPKTEFVVGPQGSASTMIDLGSQDSGLASVHIRPTTTVTETDVAAIEAQPDTLMTLIGPNISDDADTSVQKP